jgi:environmental stress-induced protein Ves
MDNYIKILKEVDYKVSTWSGGKTSELFIFPEQSSYKDRDFKVRISSATVELEQSTFTKLEGVNRFITPLDNNLRLTHNEEESVDLKPFEIHEFDGGINTNSFGKARDFNLMLANGAKGELKSFLIQETKEIILLVDFGFNILYSYDCIFKIRIDEEEFMLLPNELLVMKSNTSKHIKIHSNNKGNILLSSFIE